MKIICARASSACVLLWALCVPLAVNAAESIAQHDELTLAQAMNLTAARSAALSAFASETEALTSRAELEAMPPGFVVETDFENFAGTGSASRANSLESTVRLSRTIELGNKPRLRAAMGSAEVERLRSEHRVRRSDLDAEVARRFIRVISDQASLDTARRATDLARMARGVVRERVEAGASSPAALSRAEMGLARVQIAQEHAEHELASSRLRLSVLWGDETAGFGSAAGELFELQPHESLQAYQALLDGSPDLVRFTSEARVQEARIDLAKARRKPDVSIGAGVRRLEAFGDQAFVASFSVPLGTRRRAGLEEREARAERNRVDLELQARRLELHASLFDLYQELSHAQAEAQALRSQIRPQAQSMLATTSEGYRAGRFSLLELADAQGQLIEVERDAIRAAAQFHTLLIEIQRVTGQPIRTLESRRSP